MPLPQPGGPNDEKKGCYCTNEDGSDTFSLGAVNTAFKFVDEIFSGNTLHSQVISEKRKWYAYQGIPEQSARSLLPNSKNGYVEQIGRFDFTLQN